ADSVDVTIRKGAPFLFTGKGAEKLNCQAQILNIDPVSQGVALRIAELSNMNLVKEKLSFLDAALRSAIQLRLQILATYKAQLPTPIYFRLYLDAIATAKYELLSEVAITSWLSTDEKNKVVVHQYFQGYLNRDSILNLDSVYMPLSGYYADMLLKKELTLLKLNNTVSEGNYGEIGSFKNIYRRIMETYTGNLREKLLLSSFINLSERQYISEAKAYVGMALSLIKSEQIRLQLLNWKEKQYAAFPFKLYDANNNIHRLRDYKGKLIVIDVWFTGCLNCINLSNAMHRIVERFKKNKDIVFITISTDNKKQWTKSVASGKYTSPGTINLHTNGLGWSDPMIRNYNWNGAPNQLI
ncbi:redoxin domain-containing protein, partial [Flavobacterium zepuense]